MVLIKFSTSSAAFDEDGDVEVCRILGEIEKKVMNLGTGGAIMDKNGNKIGQWEFTPDNYKEGD